MAGVCSDDEEEVRVAPMPELVQAWMGAQGVSEVFRS